MPIQVHLKEIMDSNQIPASEQDLDSSLNGIKNSTTYNLTSWSHHTTPAGNFYTGSKNVSGCPGSKISLHVITVTKSSVSDKLMILCVHPGII